MTSNGSNKFSSLNQGFVSKIRKFLKEGLVAELMRHLWHLPISCVVQVKSVVNLQEEMLVISGSN